MANLVKIQFAFFALAVVHQQVVATPYGFFVLPLPSTSSYSGGTCLLHSAPPSQRDDYTLVPGIGSYKLHTRAMPWVEARLVCEDEGGHLAIINSIAESDAIASVYQKAEPITGSHVPQFAAIGFHDLYREGQYVTIHGESLSKAGFDQWAAGQPDNLGQRENCGGIDKDGKLHDLGCDVEMFGFMCEIPISAPVVKTFEEAGELISQQELN